MGCSPCTAQTQMGPGWRKRPGSLRPLAQSRVLLRGGAIFSFSIFQCDFDLISEVIFILILFSCGLIHFQEFCVGCYVYNESHKVLNLQIIIYTTRLLPISRRNLSKGIRNDWRKSLFCRNVLILCQIAK